MVGEGVLHEALNHPYIESVLIINRRASGLTHPKLKEIVHGDFHNLSSIESQLQGYNACFFLSWGIVCGNEGTGIPQNDL